MWSRSRCAWLENGGWVVWRGKQEIAETNETIEANRDFQEASEDFK